MSKLPPEVIKYLTKNSKKGVKKRLGGKSKEEISKIMKKVSDARNKKEIK